MTRVSLREAYDNKDVVAQIYAIRDTAESAEDTAEQAVTTANTASDHVDALVPQVEGAVQNANSASASAQASAQTVAGYENRLATVESDLNAVTLRVTTAEGQIVTIQGRVTALETADGQNVKINNINQYAVGLTGNQTKTGSLTLESSVIEKVTYYSKFASIPDIRDKTTLKIGTIQKMVDNDNRPICENLIVKEANGTVEYRTTISYTDEENAVKRGDLKFMVLPTGKVALGVRLSNGTTHYIYQEP